MTFYAALNEGPMFIIYAVYHLVVVAAKTHLIVEQFYLVIYSDMFQHNVMKLSQRLCFNNTQTRDEGFSFGVNLKVLV